MTQQLSRSARLQFGPYRVIEKIGCGGMAKVYKARHQETGAIVALKIATEFSALDPTLCKRFHREFELAKALSHPHLIHALDWGDEDDILYQALEYVAGQDLDQRVREKGPIPLPEAIRIFAQIADGLGYLHQRGMLHRDIKPSNVMLATDGSAKLGDFGLLKNLRSQSSMLTKSRQSLGTIGYSAPEQFEDAKRTDARCDIYSLAATFYTAITGEHPFGSGGNLKILRRKFLNQFVPLAQMAPAIVPALDQFTTRSLNADPQLRPQSCDEFLACLKEQDRALAAAPAGASRSAGPSASGKNRRRAHRTPIHLAATCEPMFVSSRKLWTAAITNLSATGLCLSMTAAVPVDTVLHMNLQLANAAEFASKLVRVRWMKPSKDKFTLGCAFVQPLSAAELDTLHGAGTPKTAIIQAAKA